MTAESPRGARRRPGPGAGLRLAALAVGGLAECWALQRLRWRAWRAVGGSREERIREHRPSV